MKILIVGLGLIGASYAKGLSQKGHELYGVDKILSTCRLAMERGYVLEASTDVLDYLTLVDVLVISLYPNDILPFMKQYHHQFPQHLIITDTCGIKKPICEEATLLALPAKFVGSHPMAGREKVGIEYADEKIFSGANFLITPIENTNEKAIAIVKQLATDLGFGKIHLISPEFHDQMIAYTSQLTHAIAVSLVNSEANVDVTPFIGDSYRDLTRIAMINEKLWSELFNENRDYLIYEIDKFITELAKLKRSLLYENEEELKQMFLSSKEKRGKM